MKQRYEIVAILIITIIVLFGCGIEEHLIEDSNNSNMEITQTETTICNKQKVTNMTTKSMSQSMVDTNMSTTDKEITSNDVIYVTTQEPETIVEQVDTTTIVYSTDLEFIDAIEEIATATTVTQTDELIPTETTQTSEVKVTTIQPEQTSQITQTIPKETTTTSTEIIKNICMETVPANVFDEIERQKEIHTGIQIAVGIYSLDGEQGYLYNENKIISSACTIKAAYALYVLKQCETDNINIWSETLEYKEGMMNTGSGKIKYAEYGTKYTIAELLQLLLGVSDNTAYNILVSKFSLTDFQSFLDEIKGQEMHGLQYGSCNVIQRKNEWIEIYRYINSKSKYSETLKLYMTGTKYCYIADGMSNWHSYMHKSGWSDSKRYTSASDCAIIDDNYLVIILSQDYSTGIGHADSVRAISGKIEEFANSLGGKIF